MIFDPSQELEISISSCAPARAFVTLSWRQILCHWIRWTSCDQNWWTLYLRKSFRSKSCYDWWSLENERLINQSLTPYHVVNKLAGNIWISYIHNLINTTFIHRIFHLVYTTECSARFAHFCIRLLVFWSFVSFSSPLKHKTNNKSDRMYTMQDGSLNSVHVSLVSGQGIGVRFVDVSLLEDEGVGNGRFMVSLISELTFSNVTSLRFGSITLKYCCFFWCYFK